MKKILVLYDENRLGMSDFEKTDYKNLNNRVITECNGKYPNFGNKVWLQAIVSEISSDNVFVKLRYENITFEEINSQFDCVILPLANCFHKAWIPWLKKRGEYVSNIKIPVYVIACGVQADSYDDLNSLIEDVKEPAKFFIDSVYKTGGEFALRGYFTGEFFNALGYKSAVVTGCPSLYQMGRDLQITNDKVDKASFKSTINGDFHLPISEKDFDNSDFMCQGTYGKYLYDNTQFNKEIFNTKRILKYVKRGEFSFVKALAYNRIHVITDINQWMSFFIENKINFSFGSRIHGTVMAVLSGVPALLYARDSRTREMAEFYNIPILPPPETYNIYDLYDLYLSTDYTEFNKHFSEKFDLFEEFLIKHNIVDKVNQNNIFMSRDSVINQPEIINQKEIDKLKSKITREQLIYKFFS